MLFVPAGVQAKAAAQVVQHLDPLQQPLCDLQSGALAGGWEGALELVGRVADALRQVRARAMCCAGTAGQHVQPHLCFTAYWL